MAGRPSAPCRARTYLGPADPSHDSDEGAYNGLAPVSSVRQPSIACATTLLASFIIAVSSRRAIPRQPEPESIGRTEDRASKLGLCVGVG